MHKCYFSELIPDAAGCAGVDGGSKRRFYIKGRKRKEAQSSTTRVRLTSSKTEAHDQPLGYEKQGKRNYTHTPTCSSRYASHSVVFRNHTYVRFKVHVSRIVENPLRI